MEFSSMLIFGAFVFWFIRFVKTIRRCDTNTGRRQTIGFLERFRLYIRSFASKFVI